VRTFEPLRLFAAALAAVPSVVLAHPGHGGTQALWQGFMHPLGGLDHVLATIAVGVIAAKFGGRALWAMSVSFLGTIALAGAVGMAGVGPPAPEAGIACR
jgi:urease accessory protein